MYLRAADTRPKLYDVFQGDSEALYQEKVNLQLTPNLKESI